MNQVTRADLTKLLGKVLKSVTIPVRGKSIEPLVNEFFSALKMASISFRPARDIQLDWKAAGLSASKAAALSIELKKLTPYGRKAIVFALKDKMTGGGSSIGEMEKFLDALSGNLWRLSDKWKKENREHRSSDVKGDLLANWSIIFFERLTGKVATGTNAASLTKAIFKLFSHETNGSPSVHLKKAVRERRRLEARWSSQAA